MAGEEMRYLPTQCPDCHAMILLRVTDSETDECEGCGAVHAIATASGVCQKCGAAISRHVGFSVEQEPEGHYCG